MIVIAWIGIYLSIIGVSVNDAVIIIISITIYSSIMSWHNTTRFKERLIKAIKEPEFKEIIRKSLKN